MGKASSAPVKPTDLKVGERVLMRCVEHPTHPNMEVPAIFEGVFGGPALREKMIRDRAIRIGPPGAGPDLDEYLAEGRTVAVMNVGGVKGIFEVHPDGHVTDDAGRRIVLRRIYRM